MRTEQDMYRLILDYARKDDNIRAVVLNGSRANPNAKRDPFQDFDIVYLVRDVKSYKKKDMSAAFGDILIMERTDISYLDDEEFAYVCYLMQFKDGNRIDLTIDAVENFHGYCFDDRLSVVLLDKDGFLPPLPAPDESSHYIRRPSQEGFHECITDFWWTAVYVAKGLWRGQVLYAQNHLERCTREHLIRVLSWMAGAGSAFSVSFGKCGDRLKDYLPHSVWQQFLQTYCGCAEEDVWNALFTACRLFEQVSEETAEKLGYTYPFQETATNVTAFLAYIRTLPRDSDELCPLEEQIYHA